ncbi:NSFL1 cofactor p47 [Patella vulgata]|uniref:NSFL1 cofactor p47 n=1 Tax=Patella vulgata TaxID=6465 RepID=UPI00217FD0B2|nr:NSFL1 cofactor p47 [Patella vulgata]
MAENDEKIQHFIAVTGVDEQRATFYLESSAWNLEMATASFFEDGDQDDVEEMQMESADIEEISQPEMATAAITGQGQSKDKKNKPASNSRFGTISSFQQQSSESDSSEEEGQAYYAGGSERSGQQVIGPPKKKDKNVVENLFKSAKEHGAEAIDKPEDRKSAFSTFRGTGYKLGQTDDDSETVQGGALKTAPRQVDMVLKLWKNGFSVDNGPLREFKDPGNKEFLDSVSKGEVPRELISMGKGGEVSLNMEDHRNEDFVKPKGQLKAFTGEGHTLGSPVPNVVSNAPSTSSASSASKPVSVSVDESQPTTNLQIRLADGTRLVSKFNHSHKVSDIRGYIVSNRPQYAGTNFVLQTTFPNKELSDESQTLVEANLINAVIVQRLK